MKKSFLTLLTAGIMAASMSITSWAMTAEEVVAKNPTSYTAGTNSVYGSALSQEQLNAVAQATADFMTDNITEGMDTDQKIKAAYDYIKDRTTYVNWDAVTGANTAYTLVTGQGACSGMCRSMKALCDAMGVECYHVHSTSNDHQWNLVRFGDGVLYHVDIDANKSAGQDIIYKSLTHPLPFDTSAYPAVGAAQVQEQTQTQPQPTDGTHTMRASQEGAKVRIWTDDDNLPVYQSEVRHDVKCGIIDKKVGTFRILSNGSNIDPTDHYILIFGATSSGFSGDLGSSIPFVTLAEPIEYPLEYDKPFSLDFTGNNMSGEELAKFCNDNNAIINISVIDRNAPSDSFRTGFETNVAYATSSSVQTGIGSSAN
ncbi:transglutaminase domain-containing protein [Dysgonomonas gadei]|uniref:transglutaminase domain-containing protein n=1 Tax=Dysgonomonas gadei TaxID=156974 RepID=UPI003AEF4027